MTAILPSARRDVLPTLAGWSEPPATGGRWVERRLLFWIVPLSVLACLALSRSSGAVQPSLADAARSLGLIAGACVGLHILLSLVRFDGDQIILPALSILLLIGAAYHLGLPGARGTTSIDTYLVAAVTALAVVGFVVLLPGLFRRLGHLFEEKVWWRVAGDLPYYESTPFHLILVGLMVLLVGWLFVRGRVSGPSGAIVIVPVIGHLSFTPSEFIRLAVAFFLADYLGQHSRILRNLRQPVVRIFPLNRLTIENRAQLVVLLTTVLLYCAFFVGFRDFGPAAIIFGLTLLCLGAATLRPLTPLILLGVVLLIVYVTAAAPALAGARTTGTLQNRLAMWLDPWDTHFMYGDHQARILWGIASGGWFGIGSGVANLRVQLPEAARDTAFAGIATAMGLWVGLCVLALYAAIAWRGYRIAAAATTDRGRLLAFSLTSLLAIQVVWIAGAMVRVFPFSGINVPFLSTGLSNAIASAIAVGALLNLSRGAPRHDGTEATPEVKRGVRWLSWPVLAGFLLPAAGLVLYGAPPLLGDQTLMRPARSPGREGEPAVFHNPYLEAFRQQFGRGRIYSADGALLAVSHPTAEDRALIRKRSPAFLSYLSRHGDADRFYPVGALTAQLVGWTTQGRFAARSGSVETAFDGLLRGYRERDLPNLYRSRHNPFLRRPEPQDLRLTIDTRTQRSASRHLQQAVRAAGGAGGALVLMDASTGQVLAAVTEPSFDPNGLTVDRMQAYVDRDPRSQILVNKALAREALYFPGSTFKILTAAAALQSPVSGAAYCRGYNGSDLVWRQDGVTYRRPTGRIHDFGAGAHGRLDLDRDIDHAMEASCNVFFATLATHVGASRLHETLERAELSAVPPVGRLAAYLPEAGFGQVTVKTAPVEMAQVAAAIGLATPEADEHGAAAARPYWVDLVINGRSRHRPDGVYGAPSSEAFQPFPLAVARRLRGMMLGVVNDPGATAYGAFHRGSVPLLPGVSVGGKTGTAEFEKQVTRGGRRVRVAGTHAWFVGFARNDREVQPRTVAFAVLVEDVRGRVSTGGHVCAPVAREVLADLLGPFPEPEPAPPVTPSQPSPWWRFLDPRHWF
jgi:cell division protein FtsI/penicillin-binding protein 2/cell division protein FtsW (lipid II flippase)